MGRTMGEGVAKLRTALEGTLSGEDPWWILAALGPGGLPGQPINIWEQDLIMTKFCQASLLVKREVPWTRFGRFDATNSQNACDAVHMYWATLPAYELTRERLTQIMAAIGHKVAEIKEETWILSFVRNDEEDAVIQSLLVSIHEETFWEHHHQN